MCLTGFISKVRKQRRWPHPKYSTLLDSWTPIPGENPAGRPLRADSSPNSLYYQIKDARAAARSLERSMVFEEDEQQNVGTDWKAVLEVGPKRACRRIEGLGDRRLVDRGVRASTWLRGIARRLPLDAIELVEQFWDVLYPLPGEEGLLDRVAPCRA